MIERNTTGNLGHDMEENPGTGDLGYDMEGIPGTGDLGYDMERLSNTGNPGYDMDSLRSTGSIGRSTDRGYKEGKRRLGRAGILKYVVSAVIIAYIVVLMIFTSGSTKSFAQVEKAVEASLDTSNLKPVGGMGLKRYYGLNSADYEGVMLYSSEVSMSTEEVLLIKVKNEDQVRQVKDAVQKRLENRKKDFDGYAPQQVKLIEQAQLSVRGKFVFLAVAPKAEAYKDAFAKSL